MQITIESTELTQKISQKNNPYYLQQAFVHLVDDEGKPQRYPREIKIFPQRDNSGKSIAYAKGDYLLADTSFDLDQYDNLTCRNIRLIKK